MISLDSWIKHEIRHWNRSKNVASMKNRSIDSSYFIDCDSHNCTGRMERRNNVPTASMAVGDTHTLDEYNPWTQRHVQCKRDTTNETGITQTWTTPRFVCWRLIRITSFTCADFERGSATWTVSSGGSRHEFLSTLTLAFIALAS